MAISKGLRLISLGFYAFSEGIATPVCGLARNDSVYILFAKLLFFLLLNCLTIILYIFTAQMDMRIMSNLLSIYINNCCVYYNPHNILFQKMVSNFYNEVVKCFLFG